MAAAEDAILNGYAFTATSRSPASMQPPLEPIVFLSAGAAYSIAWSRGKPSMSWLARKNRSTSCSRAFLCHAARRSERQSGPSARLERRRTHPLKFSGIGDEYAGSK